MGSETTATETTATETTATETTATETTPTGAGPERRLAPARQEKSRAERQRILRAAYEPIERDGSKETSVHDVLHAAGLSTRAFYRHLRSRDELVPEMYRVDCGRVNAAVPSAVAAAPDPLPALAAWIDQNLAVVYDA